MWELSSTLKTFAKIVEFDPGRTAFVALILLLAGLSEGLGIGALLPLFQMIISSGPLGDTQLGRYIQQGFAAVGIEPTVTSVLILVVGSLALKGGLVLLALQQVGVTAARLETRFRMDLIRNLITARWRYFIDQPSGRFANAVTNEAFYASYCYELICRFIAEAFQLIVYSGVALLVSWKMTLIGLASAGLCGAVLGRFVGMARMAGDKQTNLLKAVSSRLIDALQGIKPLKAMACEERIEPLLEAEIRGLRDARSRQVLASAGVRSLYEPLLLAVLAVGGYLAFTVSRVNLEVLMILLLLAWRALARVGQLQFLYQELARYESAFWSLHSAIEDAGAAREPASGSRAPRLERRITLQNVTFSYGDAPVLQNVSFPIDAGRFTSVTGPSGVGKTTVADLIIGLVRPDSGEIYIDDLPMSEADLKAWRRTIGYVPQETVLFHDTIYTNVTLGDPAFTRTDAERALHAAGAWNFVSALPARMDTVVGERGGKLSGGERQRIAIARALIRKPELLILDEVTSALDPATEAEICATLKKLKGKVTILAISHQPALVHAADTIYSLDGTGVDQAWNHVSEPRPARTEA